MKHKHTALSLVLSLALSSALCAEPPAKLELNKGDHISIIGNGLADRMQHDGTLEAFIAKAHPQDDISIRNLGFTADEVTSHMRSDGVAPPEEWLAKAKTDVVFAFWGFNESFRGSEGVDAFKAELDKYVKDMKAARYNGKSNPRLILFSPIAQEKMPGNDFPDPTANNANLQIYTAAMAEVARANDIQFVDLFAPSQQLYKEAKEPLTHNGIHLTVAGYEKLAPVIYKAVFGADAPAVDETLAKIRQAVQVKNEMWMSRYRTVDQYNIYGGRSKAPVVYENGKGGPKVANEDVMHPEMAVRDVMTENREKRVWAVAKGGDLQIDDSNTPEVPKVKTNRPGPNPDGSYPFLDPEEAIKHMTVPKGVKVELVASEKQFPELVSPVQMNWDTKGRLWIAAWKNYPERTPWSKDGDKLLVFDIGPDGKATKCTTFIDGLNCPTGFQFYKDGVVVMESPDLWFVRDTTGEGKANWKERILDGLDAADSHHETNSMAIEPGGAIYLSDGIFHRTQVETAWGPVRNQNGCLYRWEPRTGRFERYIAHGFANPHGKVFDYWGNDLITDATGNVNYFAPAFSGHIDYPGSHPGMKPFWERPSRPCPGTAILSSRAWPEEFQNNFLNCNVISIQGIFRAKLSEEGSGLKGETIMKTVNKKDDTLDNLVSSDDPNFRPSGISVAPDGSLYFMDWHKPLIGHLQHHLRDPNREQSHGRIYRLTYEGRTVKPFKVDGQPIEALLDLLKEPENDVRTRAKLELGKHDTAEVISACDKWAAALDKTDKAYEHHMTEALWLHQWHNVVNIDLLKDRLASPDYHARAAATRVLCYWRDRVPEAIALLKVQANDESPRVRLEAVRALSFFSGDQAQEALAVAYDVFAHPMDYYLDYTSRETMNQLKGIVKVTVLPTDPKVLASVLDHMTNAELLKTPANEATLLARLERSSIDINERLASLNKYAALHKISSEESLAIVLQHLDGKGQPGSLAAQDLGKLFGSLKTTELAKARAAFVAVAGNGTQPGVRSSAWAAIIIADGKATTTWADAKTDAAKEAIAGSMAMISDADLREQFQPIYVAAINDPTSSPQVRAAAMLALPLMGKSNAKPNFILVANRLAKGDDRTIAARALMQFPRDTWDKSAAGPVAASILAWAKTVPAAQRSEQEYVETAQTGMEMAGLLGSDGVSIRKQLRGLGVSVFVIKTVREQMRYDTPRIVVEAGKPFEVIMENMDFMPHNLVFVEPGTRLDVAKSVANMKPDKLDSKGRAYMPDPKKDKRFIDGTKLVEAGQKTTLKLTAPRKEGEYEYVCTFPEHAQMMYGTLVVTKDVDAYLAAHPVAAPQPVGNPADHNHNH